MRAASVFGTALAATVFASLSGSPMAATALVHAPPLPTSRRGGALLRRSVGMMGKPRPDPDAPPPEPASIPDALLRAPRPPRGDMKSKWGGSKPRRRSNQGKALEAGMTNPSRLRVMGGSAKGRRLDSPDVQLRPMMGKVKEALFSTLTGFGLFDREDTKILDMFSGSGSVGLEALSRGASKAVFVDFAQECIDVAEKNAVWCGFETPADARGVCAPVESVLLQPARYGLDEPFELITITPPYEEVVYADLCQWVCDSPLVAEDTVVVLEYPTEMGTLPPTIGTGKLVGVRNRRYGRTMIGIYASNPSGKWNLDVRSEEFLDIPKK